MSWIMDSLIALFGLGAVGVAASRLGWINLPSKTPQSENSGSYNFSDDIQIDNFGYTITPADKRYPVFSLTISPEGLNFIKDKEGFSGIPYKDSGGTWTIGYGTTRGINQYSDTISRAEAEELMLDDINSFHNDLSRLIKVPLKQNEYDALMSFIYNLGSSNLASSTLLFNLNHGDYLGAANEFPRWSYVGNTKVAGLEKRRKQEQQTFLA